MVKNAIKRGQSRTCSSYAEREHFRRSQWSKMRLSEGRAELVRAMPSVSILGEANDQCPMVNVQWSKMRLSERRAELVRAMPSVSILGEANGQRSMVNVKDPVQCQNGSISSRTESSAVPSSTWQVPQLCPYHMS